MGARLIATKEGNKYGKGGYNQLFGTGSELQVSKYMYNS